MSSQASDLCAGAWAAGHDRAAGAKLQLSQGVCQSSAGCSEMHFEGQKLTEIVLFAANSQTTHIQNTFKPLDQINVKSGVKG